jgi:hypothetical protein
LDHGHSEGIIADYVDELSAQIREQAAPPK